jgi:replicative DNA helicase
MRSHQLLDRIIENISPDEFTEGPCRQIYEVVCGCYHNGDPVSFDSLMLQLEDADLKHLLDRLDEESQAKDLKTEVDLSEQLNIVIGAFERERQELDKRQDMSSLTSTQLNPEEEANILERMFQQAKERQGIQ